MEKNSWKPRLKDGTRRAPIDSETNRMAAQALDKMKKVERRRIEGTLDREYLEKIAGKKIEIERKPWNKGLLLVPAILVLPLLAMSGSPRHSVSGTVNKNKAPLPGAEVTLRGERSYQATADEQGKFSLDKVVPGEYKLTIEAEIDPGYADPNTTPLVVNVTRDIENIRIQTYSKMPQTKKPTWEPGVD